MEINFIKIHKHKHKQKVKKSNEKYFIIKRKHNNYQQAC